MNIIDLFCGAGGMSKGFHDAGYNVLMGIDFNNFAIKTHEYNFPNSVSISEDLTNVSPEELLLKYNIDKENIDGIIGGPPCQGFSVAGKRSLDDPRNKLFLEFVRFVEYIKPKFFLIENVVGLLSYGNGSVKNEILNVFGELGYNVKVEVLDASHYLVPQSRKRVFFLGYLGEEPVFPKPISNNNPITVGDSIMDLPELFYGEEEQVYDIGGLQVHNHFIYNVSDITLNRISSIPVNGSYDNIPEELKRNVRFNSAYRRLQLDKPAFTITSHFRDEYVLHPIQNRIISIREAARLQSFPDDFRFFGSKSRKGQNGLVGNAVPPKLAFFIALEILHTLSK